MVLYVCSVFDSATQAYSQPFFVNALGQATRSFTDEVNNPAKDTDLSKHPTDFELFHLGLFDNAVGRFQQSPDPVLLARGKDSINTKE